MQEINWAKWVLSSIALLIAGTIALFGFLAIAKSFARYQARADAENRVKVSAIEIKNQEQRVQVAKQQNEIKHQLAIGQRKANEEVAKKLTPLFVQFEMIEALKAIAESGHNNTVIYIPSGANGVPLVSVSDKPQVFQGDSRND